MKDSLFDFPQPKIDKPIRIIEAFGGYGSQSMALRNIGADFERWKLIEFDPHAVASYNAIHGTNFEPLDIRDVRGTDLQIVDKDKYCYILFYSWPCTSLSLAGKQEGMVEGSGTASSLLWEVKRLLTELSDEELPQYLMFENVSQCHSDKHLPVFKQWLSYLDSRGYKTFYKDLNAKDFGIPQSRNRCFGVSILTDEWIDFEFPEPTELKIRMKDLLDDEVGEEYYIRTEKADKLLQELKDKGVLKGLEAKVDDLCLDSPNEKDTANCVKARYDAGISNLRSDGTGVAEKKGILVSDIGGKFEKETDTATCLMARDYKGFGHQNANAVLDRVGRQ